MSLRERIPMSMNRLPHGAIQWTFAFNLQDFETVQFAEEGLELPQSLLFAVKKRQIEFLCGRLCAKRCLEDLGFTTPPLITVADDRSPIWPSQVVGSISHTDRLVTAIVGPADRLDSVGVDIERVIADATPQMIKHICCDVQELQNLANDQGLSREQALTLIFSGKESLYKAVYPQLKRFYGFQAARVFSESARRLRIELVTDLSDAFPLGKSWTLNYLLPSVDLLETMVLKGKS